MPLPATATWKLPGDLGRRYGAVSGDLVASRARTRYGSRDGGVHNTATITGRTGAAGCVLAQPNFAGGYKSDNLIWIDLEMTGLLPDTDSIIEIATVVTDKELNILASGPALAIHQPEAVLAGMDAWNQNQHGSSGLLTRVRASDVSVGAGKPVSATA